MLPEPSSALVLLDPGRTVVVANPAIAELAGAKVEDLVGLSRDAFVERMAPIFADPADYLRRTRVPPSGPFAAREDFAAARPRRCTLRWSAKPIDMSDGVGHLETYVEFPG